jgi:hypothetical protein
MSFSISDLLSPKNDLPQKAAASPTSGDTTKGTSGTKHEAFLGKNGTQLNLMVLRLALKMVGRQ